MQMTLRYMSNNDTNEQLIREFMEYSKWSTRFELFGYKESAVKARNALSRIRKLAQTRFQEIQAKKIALHGNQNEGTEGEDDDN
jgi:hypothetical protein